MEQRTTDDKEEGIRNHPNPLRREGLIKEGGIEGGSGFVNLSMTPDSVDVFNVGYLTLKRLYGQQKF